jgi:hypothetical protein
MAPPRVLITHRTLWSRTGTEPYRLARLPRMEPLG